MPTLEMNGASYSYEDVGSGDAIVHICGRETDWRTSSMSTAPIAVIPRLYEVKAITSSYRVVSYEQMITRGTLAGGNPGITTHPVEREGVVRASEVCLALMRHAGIEKANLFAHSLVTSVALDIALRAPEKVRTLTLHEPEMFQYGFLAGRMEGWMQKASLSPENQAKAQQMMQTPEVQAKIRQALEQARQSPRYEEMLKSPQFQAMVQAQQMGAPIPTTPTDPAQIETDPYKFRMNNYILSMLQVQSGSLAERIKQPTLSMLTSYSNDDAKKSDELLKSVLPQAQSCVVKKPSALWRGVEDPNDLAPPLLDFLSRYA